MAISTYLSYHLLTADLTKSLTREAQTKAVTREAQYYKDNIGKVKTVDDFISNTRLYNYAMKAYGLDDMIYAKAFMRKVLQSDTTDNNSFVSKLSDTRFLTFANAFSFTTDGTVAATDTVAQDVVSEEDTIGLYNQHRTKQGTTAAAEVDYFKQRIGTIQNVDELVSNERLFNFALKTVGLDPKIASVTTIKNVLTSDLSDSGSVANTLTNDAYRTLAAAFSFNTDGTVNGSAQTSAQTTEMLYDYYEVTGTDASPAGAAFRTAAYKEKLATVTNVDDLLADDHIREYIVTSFGLDPVLEGKDKIRQILTSDLSDSSSYANTLTTAYQNLAKAFNFKTDGSLDSGVSAQTTDQQKTTVDGFYKYYTTKADRSDGYETDYYRLVIPDIKSVEQILSTEKLFNFVVTAFGLDPATETKDSIRKALTSDLADPFSFANTSRKSAYKAMAAAFNFDANGLAQVPRTAQTEEAKLQSAKLYSAAIGDSAAAQDSTRDENAYYGENIDKVRTVGDLLDNDRLVTYILKAYGLESKNVTSETLSRILTSDVSDPDSFVNQPANRAFRDLASAFNFNTDGSIDRASNGSIQSRFDQAATADMYVRASLEEKAGESSSGVRLALYFQRTAPKITSAYSILADKALFEVTRTALGLPASMSLAEIETQANMITKKLNLDDLKDPAKLDKFLARFSALYDINNSTNDQLTLVQALFGTSS